MVNQTVIFEGAIDGKSYTIPAAIVPMDAMATDVILGRAFLDTVSWIERDNAITFNSCEDTIQDDEMSIMNIFIDNLEASQLDINPELSADQQRRITSAIYSCTGNRNDDPSKCPVKMKIELRSEKTIRARPRRFAYHEEKVIEDIVQDWLSKGYIRPSSSEYASPVTLAKKKSGEYRLCVDYREINKITAPMVRPIPRIDELLAEAGRKKYFTRIDLKDAFFHVFIEENSIRYTAFIVASGQYEFLVAPFGLRNSPLVFAEFVYYIFRDLIINKKVRNFFDDLLIATDTIEENISILEQVIQRMCEFGLEARIDKCCFVMSELEYLGYVLKFNEVRPGKSKSEAVELFPIPRTPREVKSFLGLTGFFRKFIPNYALIALPLTSILRKGATFKIDNEQLIAIKKLKDALVNEPLLKTFDFNKETEVHTDASSRGYSAILLKKKATISFILFFISARKLQTRKVNIIVSN